MSTELTAKEAIKILSDDINYTDRRIDDFMKSPYAGKGSAPADNPGNDGKGRTLSSENIKKCLYTPGLESY